MKNASPNSLAARASLDIFPSGKHKVSIEIDLGALEDSFLPYYEMTPRQHGSGGTHLHKLERLQFE